MTEITAEGYRSGTSTTTIDSKNGAVCKHNSRTEKKSVKDDLLTTFSSPAAWILVAALIITWAAVAIVMLDLIDYKPYMDRCDDPCLPPGSHHSHVSKASRGTPISKGGISKFTSDPKRIIDEAVKESTDWLYGYISWLSDMVSPVDEDEDDNKHQLKKKGTMHPPTKRKAEPVTHKHKAEEKLKVEKKVPEKVTHKHKAEEKLKVEKKVPEKVTHKGKAEEKLKVEKKAPEKVTAKAKEKEIVKTEKKTPKQVSLKAKDEKPTKAEKKVPVQEIKKDKHPKAAAAQPVKETKVQKETTKAEKTKNVETHPKGIERPALKAKAKEEKPAKPIPMTEKKGNKDVKEAEEVNKVVRNMKRD